MDGASSSRPGHPQDQLSAELNEILTGPMAAQIRAEMEFARVKNARRGAQAASGAQDNGIGWTLAIYGAGYLVACAIIAAIGVMTPWLGGLIVGTGILAAAAVLVFRQSHQA